jgi:pimeloyl-ACP methyl ester carboxylesterase
MEMVRDMIGTEGRVRATAPLPWEWFDFLEAPREARGSFASVEQGGAERVWKVMVDGRVVPFKFFGKGEPGSRPLLMMLHGMGITIASFRGVSGYLFEDHDLALPDYSSLSCEASGWPQGGVAIRAMTHAVWRVADALGVEKFSLCGNSLGGAMCLLAALEHPERVERMALANPACYPQPLPTMYRLARVPVLGELLMTITRPEKLIGGLEYIGYVDKARFVPELRERYLAVMQQRRNRFRLMEMIRHLPHDGRDMTLAMHIPRLKEIGQPVMVTFGERDPLLIPGVGARLARELGNAVYRPYADLSHMPQEEAPDRVGPEWAEFLRG